MVESRNGTKKNCSFLSEEGQKAIEEGERKWRGGCGGKGGVEKGRRRGMWGGGLGRGEGISGGEAPRKRGEPKGTFLGVRTGEIDRAALPP